MGSIGLADALASAAVRFEGSAAARDVLVRMLDLRPTPCVKTSRYVFESETPHKMALAKAL